MAQLLAFDGSTKGAVPLSALRPSAWVPEDDDPDSGADVLGVRKARRAVGTLYRCVDIRGKAVADVPFRLEQNGKALDIEDPAVAPLAGRIRRMLLLSEGALCCYGAAYFELGRNVVGRNLTPFWLAPQTVMPITTLGGLDGFRRTAPGGVTTFTTKTSKADPPIFKGFMYAWLPGIEDELAPDVAPARVALMNAGVVLGLDGVLQSFFRRGLIKVTLFQVEGNRPPQDMEKLQTWANRVMAGMRNAWRSIVIRDQIKPVVIGDGIKDISSREIREDARTGIAETMGVPQSLLMSEVLAGGTADAEQLGFYVFTVLPECRLLAAAYNSQYLNQIDMQLVFEPEKLPVMQKAELAKAEAVSRLVPGQPVLDVDEARALIGYGPKKVTPAPALPAADEDPVPDPGEGGDLDTAKALERLRLARLVARQVLAGKSAALTPWVSVVLTHREQQAIRDAVAGLAAADPATAMVQAAAAALSATAEV